MRSSNNLEYSDIFSDKALVQMIICGFIYVYSFDNVPNEIISKVIKLIKRNNFFGYPENLNYLYDYIKALVISIIDNRSVYEKCVDLIVDANTSVNYNEEIKEKISNRLDDLLLLDNEIDKRNISKIDLVLTKTNVNLKIVNKTSEIMLKYQNYESKLIINYENSPKTKSYSILHLICIVLVIIVILVLIFLILKNMWYNNT